MSGLGIPTYFLLQYGTQGMSWIFMVMGLMWCGFTWWKTCKNRGALAVLITAAATMTSIMIMVGFWVVAMFSLGGGGTSSATGELIEGLLIGLMTLLVLSWAGCSICFFTFGSGWKKELVEAPNKDPLL